MIGTIGIVCIIIGFIFKAFPPQKINGIYGYRTPSSMKNQDTWNESQKYSANALIILGFIYLALGFLLSHLFEDISIVYENIIILIGVIIMILLDEVHLKKVFNKDGSRKSCNINKN
ncbi:SdpC immunity protein SpdL [Clostridium sardiniense]